MGMCVSCESANVATAKVISQDGKLQEYSYPVKVSYVLSKLDSSSFLCNSDDMEFDDVVSAVRDDDELEPGQLYFVLPLSKLSRPLQPEEMAALAVKANAALLNSATADKCGCRKKSGASFFGSGDRSAKVADVGVTTTRRVRDRSRNTSRRENGGGRNKKFAAQLSAIPE